MTCSFRGFLARALKCNLELQFEVRKCWIPNLFPYVPPRPSTFPSVKWSPLSPPCLLLMVAAKSDNGREHALLSSRLKGAFIEHLLFARRCKPLCKLDSSPAFTYEETEPQGGRVSCLMGRQAWEGSGFEQTVQPGGAAGQEDELEPLEDLRVTSNLR